MKKIFLGLSSVLFIVSSVMGMHRERSKSLPPPAVGTFEKNHQISRAKSVPVTNSEIEAAISKWSHLIPDSEVRNEINGLFPFLKNQEKKEELVELLCHHREEKYALYASAVFADGCINDEINAWFGGMLACIAYAICETNPSVFWQFHHDGYFE
jgi:hypothetical protein